MKTEMPEASAKADAAYAQQIREQAQLRDAQNANARANKLEKLGRKDPCIRDLLEEHRAAAGTIKLLRDRLATAEAAAADGAQAREDLTNMAAEMTELRGALGQAQKDLGARAVAIESLKADVEGLRHERLALNLDLEKRDAELVKLREQLAQALKPKK